ncbi:head GIN domain-containing protein [Sphingomonas sp. R86521]|uniref:head GIN domain-containing protein n=1 Tax=Sphingomonas sp. R86521 TaxID=3093860 RepID=UPI0036D3FF36
MKSFALGLLIPLAACSFSSSSDAEGTAVAAQGSGGARSFQVTDFTGIALKGSDDIDVRVGTGFSVRAEGPTAELDKLRIDKDGSTLNVGRKNRTGLNWSGGSKVKVFVTLPRLIEANVAGSGNMTVDRVEGSKFDGGIAGSGNLQVAALQVEEAAFSIAGSGNATAAGTAKALKIEIAGSGNVEGSKLQARSATVAIVGSGDATAVVNGAAQVDMMGSGDVDLGPNAHCKVSKMGSGSVRCAN